MKKDETWDWFLDCLWEYQYVSKPSPLNAALSEALYDVTQGITDFAIKVYMLAQIRAIADKEEIVTEQNIRLAAEEGLRMANPILTALKDNDIRILSTVEDVHPVDLDTFLEEAQGRLNRAEQLQALARTRISTNSGEALQPNSTIALESKVSPDTTSKTCRRRKKADPLEGSLPEIAARGEKQQLTAYDALQQAGLIRSGNEYLLEEVS
jgi:hypothetical protein